MRPFLLISLAVAAMAQPRTLESVIPALDYGRFCTSSIEARNLTGKEVTAEIEGHKASGALVLLVGQSETTVRIPPHGQAAFKLQVENEDGAGWVRIREAGAPALALSAEVECVEGDKLLTATRDVVYPMRQPWFTGDVAELRDGVVTAINVSNRPARIVACYSTGNLVSNSRRELVPLCSATLDLPIPPFGTRRVPVVRDGNTWFSLTTAGDALVLEMLRPLAAQVKLYRVDSTIQFGQEVAPGNK